MRQSSSGGLVHRPLPSIRAWVSRRSRGHAGALVVGVAPAGPRGAGPRPRYAARRRTPLTGIGRSGLNEPGDHLTDSSSAPGRAAVAWRDVMHSAGGEKRRHSLDIAGVAGCVVAANGLLHPLRHICFVAGAQQSASPVGRSHCAGVPESSACAIGAILHLYGSFTAALHPEGRAPWALGPAVPPQAAHTTLEALRQPGRRRGPDPHRVPRSAQFTRQARP